MDEAPAPSSDDRRPWPLVLRAAFLTLAAGVFLILMASMASALDVPDATGVVGGVTDTVADTTDTVGGTATDTVADTTDTVGGTATDTVGGTATDTVAYTTNTVVGTATDTVADTTDTVANTTDAVADTAGDVVTDTTGVVADTTDAVIEDGVRLVDGVADSALGGVSSTLDPVARTIDGVVSGIGDGLSAVRVPDLTAPDPIPIPPIDPSEPATDRPGHRPLIERGLMSGAAPTTTIDVHLGQTDAPRPDPGGAQPGSPPNGGFPSPLDVAAAAMRGLSEAGARAWCSGRSSPSSGSCRSWTTAGSGSSARYRLALLSSPRTAGPDNRALPEDPRDIRILLSKTRPNDTKE